MYHVPVWENYEECLYKNAYIQSNVIELDNGTTNSIHLSLSFSPDWDKHNVTVIYTESIYGATKHVNKYMYNLAPENNWFRQVILMIRKLDYRR